MTLGYGKYPELRMFDENQCEYFTRMSAAKVWHNFDIRNNGLRFYENAEQMTDITLAQKQAKILGTRQHMTQAIENYVFADQGFNYYYVSNTFFNAMMKSYEKLRPLMDEDNAFEEVFEDAVFVIGQRTLVFMKTGEHTYRYMEFQDHMLAFIAEFKYEDTGEELNTLQKFKEVQAISAFDYQGYDDVWTPDLTIYQQSFILFFKKYAQIEIEVIEAEQRTKKPRLLPEDVHNFLGLRFQVLDSSWYTTICRDTGFLVNGHFRLQPYKDRGVWSRKLIYINAYAKHGYHRQARIKSEQ